MTTEERSASFIDDPEFEYVPARDRIDICRTDQSNHPYPSDRPFSRPLAGSENRGTCAECGKEVRVERFAPDNPSLFTFIAEPHTRLRRYFVLSDVELDRLVTALEREWGSRR